jgi:serine/threonine protein kinase
MGNRLIPRRLVICFSLQMIQTLIPSDHMTDGLLSERATLGDFRLLREIGRGGMGVVYEAEQTSLGRRVAVKVLPAIAGADTRQLARFQIETQVAAALHHPHIVPIFAVGHDRGLHYFAMQLIEGCCLATILREPSRRLGSQADQPTADCPHTSTALLPREAARLAMQAAEALDHAHGLGVLHRDVKPANLLVDDGGHLWGTDFGLARFQGGERPDSERGLAGNPALHEPRTSRGRTDRRCPN